MSLLPAVIAALFMTGVLVMITGARPVEVRAGGPSRSVRERSLAARTLALTPRGRLILATVLGLLLGLLTGWLVLVLLVPAVVVGLPALLRQPAAATDLERLAALEGWTRGLAGSIVVGSGLEQAIRASLASTPDALRPQVARLVARLDAQQPLEQCLRLWADEVNDVTADLIAASLILGARRRSGGVSASLEELAESVAEQARMRRAIEADRSSPRASARWVTFLTLGAAALLALNEAYIEPYRTPLGQIVLVLLAAAYAGSLLWMRSISAGKPTPRFLPKTTKG